MGLAALVLVLAAAVAAVAGGRWHRLGRLRLRGTRLVVAAVLAQAGGALIGVLGVADPRHAYVLGLAASAGLALAFCARNLRVPGVPLVTAGLVANATVVALNGAMPVSIVAAYHARVPITTIAAGTDARHTIAGIGTRWRELGDILPVPLPLRPEVVSPGDVLVAAGLAELLVLGMMGWTSHRREHDSGEEGSQASRA
jgi:hypothetical protein